MKRPTTTLPLLILLLHLPHHLCAPIVAQLPAPATHLSLPVSATLGQEAHFKFQPSSLPAVTHLAVDWKASDHSSKHVILSLRLSVRPQPPLTSGSASPPLSYSCDVRNPCFGANETFVDRELFFAGGQIGFQNLSVPSGTAVHVTVLNYDRGGEGVNRDSVNGSVLTGVLLVRNLQAACGGFTGVRDCSGNGVCWNGGCRCRGGFRGRFCELGIEKVPPASLRPDAVSDVMPLSNSSVVRVGQGDGDLFRYVVEGDGDVKVVFRARVLIGNIRVEGDEVAVGGGGGEAGMFVKKAGFNGAEVLEVGTDMPGGHDVNSKGVAFVERRGEVKFYETVFVSGVVKGREEWFVRLLAGGGGGEVVYSVRVRRCGGRDDVNGRCPFENEEGTRVADGVWIAIGIVAGVLLLVLSVLCFWKRFVGRGGTQHVRNEAWKDVELREESSREISSRDFTTDSRDVESFVG